MESKKKSKFEKKKLFVRRKSYYYNERLQHYNIIRNTYKEKQIVSINDFTAASSRRHNVNKIIHMILWKSIRLLRCLTDAIKTLMFALFKELS